MNRLDPTDPRDPKESSRKNKPKSVRWPPGEVTSGLPQQSSSPSAPNQPPEDYFSFIGGSANRQQRRSNRAWYTPQAPTIAEEGSDDDTNDHDTGGNEDSIRATTRANTWFNRRTSGDDIPRVHVTPAEDTSPPSSTLSPHVNPMAHIMDVGTLTSGGLAPGAVSRPNEGMDNDPLDREYRRRRDALLGKVKSGARSQPASPALTPQIEVEDHQGEIPLMDLDRKLLNLAESDVEDTPPKPSTSRDPMFHLSDPVEGRGHRRHESSNSGISDLEPRVSSGSPFHRRSGSNHDARTTDGEEEDPEEEERRRQARAEAEDLAKALVKAHISGTKDTAVKNGYLNPDQYAFDRALLDEDFRKDLEDQVRAELEQQEDQGGGDADSSARSGRGSFENEKGNEGNETTEEPDQGQQQPRAAEEYVPPPRRIKEGVLGALLRLYGTQEDAMSIKTGSMSGSSPGTSAFPSPSSTPLGTPSETPRETPPLETPPGKTPGSGPSKPWSGLKRPGYFRAPSSSEDALGREVKGRQRWYKHKHTGSTTSLGQLAASSLGAVTAPAHGPIHAMEDKFEKERKEIKKMKKKLEQQRQSAAKRAKKAKLAEQMRITVHIADVLQRQRFILRLGRALMLFGAPTHRLEEYLKMTARVLEIDGQFLYMPGCMLVSFGDAATHTSETKLLRVTQGLNLTKLDATHLVYKEVVHDIMGMEEASAHIDNLLGSKNLYPWWLICIFYGLATASIAMFSFGGYWEDIPITFLIGGAVGFLQNWVQPRSDLYSNVFEVTSSIVVSFCGRAFGSIVHGKHFLFCFAAIVQGSLALILPGYIILCGSLELQSRNLVAGSVRMFYAIIYSLFLSFGITLGSAIYGWIDKAAVHDTTCYRSLDNKWKILFVPLAAMFMAMVNQANMRQLPVMVFIASCGYTVLFFVQQQVHSASAFSSAIGAFTIGILGNLYSRVGHGLAFAAMLPGIFIIVPSGVAAQGSLVAGIEVAQQIVNSSKSNSTASGSLGTTSTSVSDLGNTMTQVAVGITVGLFAATLVVYPLGLGKKRSGLFTF